MARRFACRHANIQLDDSAFVDQRGFRTSVMAFAGDSDHDFSDFGGGWSMILPTSAEDHFKLFEVSARLFDLVVTISRFA